MSRAPADKPEGERLHKALARAGWGSRRELERMIAAGRIKVNGKVAQLGAEVRPGDRVQLDGGRAMRIRSEREPLKILAYNKPVGEVCTRKDESNRRTIFERLPRLRHGRWINVGRLDINTSGLLLLTNNGDLAHRLMHPRYEIDREYAVRVFGDIDRHALERLREGVEIEGEVMAFKDIVVGEGEGRNRWYYCVVQSGRNREVRQLWESQNVQVSRLMRVRYANVMLPTDLRAGRSVELGGRIVEDLLKLVDLKVDNVQPAKRRR